ncbi:DUF2934 domain-containing protein [Pelagibacterium sp. 26DY04]|uniref:DUF2934 domain-containing protein n=1 Tax=unclassified Pelagibacterium TaxID=2623280 RepID=UPI002814A0E4|nr:MULTISPECIES: DUF2934 domain-containing protein [unclassified Pelagibacterium]WMT86366.1 DUF2934 domain-containing protein [Pelagibacterium sp. 26DY04]WMT89389.1 DUF2934 domain-containing protein [Pelagibacterium sp. H642]
MNEIDTEAIRRRAYEIWEREGCPHGKHQAHWLQAQAELAGDPDLPGSPGGGADATESATGAKPFKGGPLPSAKDDQSERK